MTSAKRRKHNDGGSSHSSSERDNDSASFASFGSASCEDATGGRNAASAGSSRGPDAPGKLNGLDGDDDKDNGSEKEAERRTFSELGIIDALCDACTELGYTAPTPIQVAAIPVGLEGRDIIGLAETGSGKTAAFAIPMLQALMANPQPFFGLVLSPTRELAVQIAQAFEALGSLISVRCAVLVGGMDMVSQSISLGKKPHVVVATPGRLLDHLENTKGFSLRRLRYLVLDEADRLLDLDFGPVLDKILKILPHDQPARRQTMLFSATMSAKVESLQRAALVDPVKVSVADSDHQTVATLRQAYLFIPHKYKDIYLVYLLAGPASVERTPTTAGERTGAVYAGDGGGMLAGARTIIFTRTVHESQRISILLRTLGVGAIPIHGQLSQSARLGALNKFRARARDVLVATDVAARGLDLPAVDAVINYDLPPDSKTYVHRVGRTARAGRSGRAISFVSQYDIEVWLRIERALNQKLPELESVVKEEAMVLAERVGEAQRVAVREMKDLLENRGRKGGLIRVRQKGGPAVYKRGRNDDMDREEG